jgi:glutathione S-transferase
VPTTRPRHPITETPEIAEILDEARRRWGDLPRVKLIQLILHDWAGGGHAPAVRSAARTSLEGSMPGTSAAYDRAADWPA